MSRRFDRRAKTAVDVRSPFSKYWAVDSVRSRMPTLPDGVAAQHGHLSASIHNLRHAHATGVDWAELAALLDRLIEDVRTHFELEEIEMDRAGYPRLEQHRGLHASFLTRLYALRLECDRRETELMGVLVELLEAWFKSHEQTADKHALEFLNIEE